MHDASQYRAEAQRARRLARSITHPEVVSDLERIARHYEEMAEDLERGADRLRYPELLPRATL